MGINTTYYKTIALGLVLFFAGALAGASFAHYSAIFNSNVFGFMRSYRTSLYGGTWWMGICWGDYWRSSPTAVPELCAPVQNTECYFMALF